MSDAFKVEAPSQAAKRSRARGVERRDAILNAAVDLIARLGFEGLRVADVAKAVGINNASLHHHYATKEDLIFGVVERFVRDFESAQPAQLEGDAAQRLETYLAGVRHLMRTRPEMFVVMNELMVRAARDPRIAALVAPSQERWSGYLVSLWDDTSMSDAEKRRDAERLRHELLGESLALAAGGDLGAEARGRRSSHGPLT